MKMQKKLFSIFVLCLALGLGSSVFAANAPIALIPAEENKAPDAAEASAEASPAEGAPAAPEEHHDAAAASSRGGHGNVDHQAWHFKGMFGTYDKAALQRGFKIYREVCSACHSMKRVYYRNLEALGYNEGQIKNIASQYNVTDGPNDEGEMFERPALPSDHFVSPYPNDKAAKYANNGALPPDLSLIVKARHHGPGHVYGILTGYDAPPANVTLLPGQNWNSHMPGNIIAMAKPLSDGQVVYEDDEPQTVDQYARDVAEFLAWAGDPYMEERKRTGIAVIIFLAVFAGIMYAYKRKIWSSLH